MVVAREFTWSSQLFESKEDFMVKPVIVRLLFGLGLGEIRFWIVRNGIAWGRL